MDKLSLYVPYELQLRFPKHHPSKQNKREPSSAGGKGTSFLSFHDVNSRYSGDSLKPNPAHKWEKAGEDVD